ncbi:MAG: OmpA family protein, partial [bacterium]|nr:OmpA family protein [bacterium]
MSDQPPIIIKKIKKHGGHAHHGGAWKVAYADFVTAMMAFFLLMWLLNATSEEQKRGLSNYFGPLGKATGAGGTGGVLGGTSIQSPGNFSDDDAMAPAVVSPEVIEDSPEEGEEEVDQASSAPELGQESPGTLTEEQLTALAQDFENQVFEETAEELKKVLEEMPNAAELADNIIIEQTPEGLRIQLIDQEKISMFPTASSKMFDHTKELIQQIAAVVTKMDNKIALSGHTDAHPYFDDSQYGNWELSVDRALAARRELIKNLPINRIDSVVGKEATDPLKEEDPYAPQNRRITILLKRKGDKPSVF